MVAAKSTTFFADKKVLVIDDSQMLLTATRAMLIKNGCVHNNVTLVKDAKSAISACKITTFDFILCDYNLGEGTDGLQLLDQLRADLIIPEKTVVFVVTGEMSKSIFYGFAEYEPDGYLIKPVNINAIANRLAQCYRQKTALSNINIRYRKEGIEQAIALCEQYPQTNTIALAKAAIYEQEKQYDKAQKIYVGLINDNDQQARIRLAELLTTLEKYDLAIKLVTPLLTDKSFRFKALQIQAACYLKSNMLTKAQGVYVELSKISSANIERLLVQYNLAIQTGERDLLHSLSLKISSRINNSRWSTVDLHLLPARTCLHLATYEKNTSVRETYLSDFLKRIKLVEGKFKLKDYQWHRDILRARYYLLIGKIKEAKEIWQSYKDNQNIEDFYGELDVMLLGFALEGNVMNIQDKATDTILQNTQNLLRHHYKAIVVRDNQRINNLIVTARNAELKNESMKAIQTWLAVWQLQPFQPTHAISLIKGFSEAIPMDMPLEELKTSYSQAIDTVRLNYKPAERPKWFEKAHQQVRQSFENLVAAS